MERSLYLIHEKFNKVRLQIEDITNIPGIYWPEVFQKMQDLETPIDWEWTWKERGYGTNDNCVSFALTMSPSYREKVKNLQASRSNTDGRFFASPLLLEYLIDRNILKPVDKPSNNLWCELPNIGNADCLIIYYCNKQITHIGIYNFFSKTVDSKWGSWPAILTHSLEQVPMSYGTEVRLFIADQKTNFENHFEKFIENNLTQTIY